MTLSKEQLIKEVAKLENQLSAYKSDERAKLQEFAKAFGRPNTSVYSKEVESMSWEQVFIMIGRLLEIDKLVKDERGIWEMEDKIRMQAQRIMELENKYIK